MPHPRRLDRRAIVSATVAVLDERGLDKVSLHAVAARLGVRQPALYHHFRDKAAILAAAADELLDREHTARTPEDGERWDEFLARNACSLRRAMLAVRDGARLLATAGSRGPRAENATVQLRLLESSGFSGPDAALAFIAVSRYTIGSALEQQTARDGATIEFPPATAATPATHLATIAAQVAELGPDHEFEVGLTALIRGLAELANDPS